MNLYIFISITSIFYATAFGLSFDFVPTAAPSGSSYGDVTVHTMCDPTRVCKQDTQSRSQCQRWNCCWLAMEKKCYEKKHFIIKPDEPKGVVTEYQYEAVETLSMFNEARSLCQGKGMDLAQHNPKLYSKAGRQEIADSIDMATGPSHFYWLGIKRFEKDNNMYKRVSDEQLVQLDGWVSGQAFNGDIYDFVYWARQESDNKDTIANGKDEQSYFVCEKVVVL